MTYHVVPFPRSKQNQVDWLELMHRQHTVYILLEADVTKARQDIRKYRVRTGQPLSLTAFLTACYAQAIGEHTLLNAYRQGRRRLVTFEDVDVTGMVEREMEGEKVALPFIIRAANQKSSEEIERQIRVARTTDNPESSALRWAPLWMLVPSFLRRFVLARVLRNPHRRKSISGTTMVTNAGMFGTGSGWGISPPMYTASLIVGSIASKPGAVDGEISVREYLSLTVTFDHDIVDGAIAARFTQRLKELIERASILNGGSGQDSADRDEPSAESTFTHDAAMKRPTGTAEPVPATAEFMHHAG